jgi:hypothetical protein
VARHSERLPHLGTVLPALSELQGLPTHRHLVGRLYIAGSPFPTRPRWPHWTPSVVSWIRVLPHSSRPLHALAGNHTSTGHHRRYRRASSTGRLDIPLRLPANHYHDQGRQFESQLSSRQQPRGTISLDTQGSYHVPCYSAVDWSTTWVLLAIRTAFKEDLQAYVAELVYGEPLRISGELLTPTAGTVEPSQLINQIRQHIARLSQIPAARHTSPATFVHKDLQDSTHVFLRQDATRRALDPPYSGPHKVLSRTNKTFQLSVRGKTITLSADRVKPAFMLNESAYGTAATDPSPTRPPQAPALPVTPSPPAAQTTRSGSHVRFPARYLTWAAISAGGGGMWEFPNGMLYQRSASPARTNISTLTVQSLLLASH